MKKGLSVLLIVAALFGFYGGASSLTDVLACKDYWEKEGEKSTADMNKLEDGLNQLGENEQAYLDGVQQLAEGEQTLAAAEQAYAEAPAKLRAAEAAIADGEGKLDDLATLLDGIKQVHAGYNKLAAYEELRDGRINTLKNPPDTTSLQLLFKNFGVLNPTAASEGATALTNAAKKLAAQDPNSRSDEQYAGFIDALKNSVTALEAGKTLLDSVSQADAQLVSTIQGVKSQYGLAAAINAIKDEDTKATILGFAEAFNPSGAANYGGSDYHESTVKLNYQIATMATDDGEGFNDVMSVLDTAVPAGITANKNAMTAMEKDPNRAIAGYTELVDPSTEAAKKTAVGGVAQIIDGVYGSKNKVLIKGFEKAAKAAGIKLKDYRYTATSQLAKDMKSSSSIDDFYNDLKKVDKCFQKAKATAKKLKADGEKQLAAGKKQYAAGLASYKAAPAQLEDGRQQLADGKKQLAQYEDGEQQVRDGLATLMSTEPNGGLESILDRRGGDDQFDDENGHLDVKEGLDAVEVGRGYQADSGELITKEITNRAVGTAAGLGAAVLACLAALLSLIKKYKGAAVTAVLAAIAGVAGAVVGSGAGSEFSDIAGSTVGSLPWIAAGVIAAVACVFAIVNFTAKAE